MLERKFSRVLREYFENRPDKIMLVDGARQVGKTFLINALGQEYFPNYIEINMVEDFDGPGLFQNVKSVEDFYMRVSMSNGSKMGTKEDTLIFIDEIQVYPHLITLLKFLKKDGKYTYIASGSLLGVTLAKTSSIPMGTIDWQHMYPLDFEEFLWANGVGEQAVESLQNKYLKMESPDEATHEFFLDLFKKYLLVGGLPEAVNLFITSHNIVKIRSIHSDIYSFYSMDAVKYEKDSAKKLAVKRVYDLIPSNMGKKKKRVVVNDIDDKKKTTFKDYKDSFDYLVFSGITLPVQAIPTPVFPLIESLSKNLIKLYLNDVGLLTNILYSNNINAVMDDAVSINLGSVYESVVAQELKAHGKNLYYYDNRSKGEVDFLIDDYDSLSVLPLEIKSGKDYTVHSALTGFTKNPDYNVKKAFVLSNNRDIKAKGNIFYLPIYYVMFL